MSVLSSDMWVPSRPSSSSALWPLRCVCSGAGRDVGRSVGRGVWAGVGYVGMGAGVQGFKGL